MLNNVLLTSNRNRRNSMKTTYTKRVLALLLSLVVMLSMCLAGTVSAFAASGGATKMAVQPAAGTAEAEADAVSYIGAPLSGASANAQIPEYTTVTAENLNTTSTGTVYNSPAAGSSKDFSYLSTTTIICFIFAILDVAIICITFVTFIVEETLSILFLISIRFPILIIKMT